MLNRLQAPRAQASKIAGFGRYVFQQSGSRAFWALVFLVLGGLTEGISILLLIPVIRLIGPQGGESIIRLPRFLAGILGPEMRLSLLPVLGLLVLLVLAQALLARFKTIYMARLMHEMINRLRTALFESIGRARWQFIARLRMSDLNHLLTADIDRVQTAVFHLLLLIQSCVLLGVYVCVSWLISPAMTAFASVIGAIALAALYPLRRLAWDHGGLLTESRQAQYATVSEFLSALKIAKSFNAEPRYAARLAATLERMRRDSDRFVRLNSIGGVALQVSSAVGLALFVYVALVRFALPLPQIIVLVFLFMRVSPRIMALQGHLQEILVNLSAFHAMQAAQADCDRERERPALSGEPAPMLLREARFEGVTVRYAESRADDALSVVSFILPAGQITALIGPSGSGKSTVADVLMGLIEPRCGAVAIDGVALGESNRRAWRDHVAYVPQDVVLLHETIAANFRLAAADATEAMMWEALKTANAHGFVERLPDRLQTVVGERGAQLSGGERQRIALARALLRQPKLLILDEATSALDWENQMLIARAIEKLRGAMTILTIAHRPSMIAFADWVIVLEGGRVVERGQYDELVRLKDSRLARLIVGDQSIRDTGERGVSAATRE
jgi:ATP-binding cassette, subfamily C, bacterial